MVVVVLTIISRPICVMRTVVKITALSAPKGFRTVKCARGLVLKLLVVLPDVLQEIFAQLLGFYNIVGIRTAGQPTVSYTCMVVIIGLDGLRNV
jgi:hypothetical protein